MQALDIRDFEIERRLDAFARTRLTPDPRAVARARARVMREARLQFEAARSAAHVVPAATLASRRPTARRFGMPLLAASVWLGIAIGSVAAAQAGGPLYPSRVWAETLTLPTNAAARAAAEVARLDARLGDAMTAAARGDSAAVAAALDAYRQIADETIAASTGDETLEDIVAAALGRHRAVLTAVAERLDRQGHTTATAAVETAIERAIEHNTAIVAAFGTTRGGAPTGGAGTGTVGGDPGSGGGGTTGGSGAQGGGGTGSSGGGSGDGAGGAGSPGANAGNGAGGNAGSGQDDHKPSPEPRPAPTQNGSEQGDQGENE